MSSRSSTNTEEGLLEMLAARVNLPICAKVVNEHLSIYRGDVSIGRIASLACGDLWLCLDI